MQVQRLPKLIPVTAKYLNKIYGTDEMKFNCFERITLYFKSLQSGIYN